MDDIHDCDVHDIPVYMCRYIYIYVYIDDIHDLGIAYPTFLPELGKKRWRETWAAFPKRRDSGRTLGGFTCLQLKKPQRGC